METGNFDSLVPLCRQTSKYGKTDHDVQVFNEMSFILNTRATANKDEYGNEGQVRLTMMK